MSGSAGGYSGTALARKLGIKPEHQVVLVGAPRGWTIPDLPPGATVARRRLSSVSDTDVVIIFVRRADGLPDVITLGAAVFPDGAVWVAWPRKAGGHESDVTENGIRDAVLPAGLVDVKVAALDPDWSGLRLVWRTELRSAGAAPTARSG